MGPLACVRLALTSAEIILTIVQKGDSADHNSSSTWVEALDSQYIAWAAATLDEDHGTDKRQSKGESHP